MLQSHQDINKILNDYLSNYNITRAFPITERNLTQGVKNASVSITEAGLKINLSFLVVNNQLTKLIMNYFLINSIDKSKSFTEYYNKLGRDK